MFARARRYAPAYRATDYVVAGTTLRIGEISPGIARLLRGACHAAIITAANPESRRAPAAANRARHAALRVAVRARTAPAVARDPEQLWPDEAGWFVLGLSPRYAASLARRWRQNAIVLVRRGAAPKIMPLQ